jgi:hypothetical protein
MPNLNSIIIIIIIIIMSSVEASLEEGDALTASCALDGCVCPDLVSSYFGHGRRGTYN